MRSQILRFIPLAALVAPLAGQGFEGTVTMKVNADNPAMGGAPTTMDWTIKGNMSLMKLNTDLAQMGPVEIKMVIDNAAQTSTFLIPMPAAAASFMPGVPGMKIVSSLKPAATAPGKPAMAAPKKLGTSQAIAGANCDDYLLGDSLKTHACITSDLGKFSFPTAPGGGAGRGGRGGGMAGMAGGLMGAVPGWAGSLGSAGFPLKVWVPNGPVLLEVTNITKSSVDASAFAIPDGYMDAGAMGGMMGGGRAGGGAGRGGGGGGGGGGH